MSLAKPTGDVQHDITLHFDRVTHILGQRGLLLAAYDKDGRANAMTIGWGVVGRVWGLPMWTVLVRPSRYTYDCIEHAGAFTVCVPGVDLDNACKVCGFQSGRDKDKLAELGLKVSKASKVNAPVLDDCPIAYECNVVEANDLNADLMNPVVRQANYPGGNFHRVYWGKVEAVRIAADAAERLGK